MTDEAASVAGGPSDSLLIESLDGEGQGIAHRADGKVVFVEGALPGERVSVVVNRRKASFETAMVTHVHQESAQRVRPACPHFGLHEGACGGCKVQHLQPMAQLAVKQRVLEDALWHLAKVRPDNVLRPIQGPSWGYRYRARLSVRYVRKKDAVLVGFHERKSSFVADMRECHVLPPRVSALLEPLRALVFSMRARERCPQIELAIGSGPSGDVIALVLRHLEPLHQDDLGLLRSFSAAHSGERGGRHATIQWWLQREGPDTAQLLDSGGPELSYTLAEFGVRMPFRPTDFTQVNPQVNDVLVGYTLRLLQVARHESVIDWFCGLGNFTLPLATRAGRVLGVEGSKALVERARANALLPASNGKERHSALPVQFALRNLFEMTPEQLVADGSADKWLMDPPREGAFALVRALADLRIPEAGQSSQSWVAPARIVYVSCNPATLARDVGVLVHQGRYSCSAAGVVNMFPHTAHVESIAVFDRLD
ncbi:MAG: 23S rRNA (uracil(1939)-C(5))-methyltransferase RlmD [Burkholderiaceae bacterium]